MNGIVGIKPTVGLVSRTGIIPISCTQDTAGPLARTVTDAALLLNSMTGEDAADPVTSKNGDQKIDYSKYLDVNSLKDKRIGVEKTFLKHHEGIDKLLKQALVQMEQAGATIVEVEFMDKTAEFGKAEFERLEFEFKDGLNKYLAASNSKIKSLKELIAFNIQNESAVMPWFKQELLESSEKMGDLTSKAYLSANLRLEQLKSFLDELFVKQELDALCGPATGSAWCNDTINGDHWTGYGAYTPAAITGYPSITVPMGFVDTLPVGLSFLGKAFTEPQLIGIGYAYEQKSKNRKVPEFQTSIKL
jgi:amidase